MRGSRPWERIRPIVLGVVLGGLLPAGAGAAWQKPQVVGGRLDGVGPMASGPDGTRAIAIIRAAGDGTWAIARALPHRRFARALTVPDGQAAGDAGSGDEAAIAVAADREVLLAWTYPGATTRSPGQGCCDQIRTATLLPSGRFTRPQQLSPASWFSLPPVALVAPDGTRAVVWEMNPPAALPSSRTRLELALARPGKPFSPRRTILDEQGNAQLIDAVFRSDNRLQITWETFVAPAATAMRTAELTRAGRLGRSRVISISSPTPSTSPTPSIVATSPSGAQIGAVYVGRDSLALTARSAGGSFRPPTMVDSTGAGLIGLGITPAGQALATWCCAAGEPRLGYELDQTGFARLAPRTLRLPAPGARLTQAIGAGGRAAVQIVTGSSSGNPGPDAIYASVGDARSGTLQPPRLLSARLVGLPFTTPMVDGLGRADFAWNSAGGPVVEAYAPWSGRQAPSA